MAGNVKGEVRFEAEGASYTLVFTIDALCALEDRVNKSVEQIGAEMGKSPRLSLLRALFHAGLREYQPSISEKKAGEIMQGIGLDKAGALIGEAFTAAFANPEAETAEVPPKAAPEAA
jgi:hypothetical protein